MRYMPSQESYCVVWPIWLCWLSRLSALSAALRSWRPAAGSPSWRSVWERLAPGCIDEDRRRERGRLAQEAFDGYRLGNLGPRWTCGVKHSMEYGRSFAGMAGFLYRDESEVRQMADALGLKEGGGMGEVLRAASGIGGLREEGSADRLSNRPTSERDRPPWDRWRFASQCGATTDPVPAEKKPRRGGAEFAIGRRGKPSALPTLTETSSGSGLSRRRHGGCHRGSANRSAAVANLDGPQGTLRFRARRVHLPISDDDARLGGRPLFDDGAAFRSQSCTM